MPYGDSRNYVVPWTKVQGFPANEIGDTTAGSTVNIQTFLDARRKFLGNVADTTARDALSGVNANDFVYVNSLKQFHVYNGTSWVTTDSATLGGLSGATAATANTVVLRDASANITAAAFAGSGSSLTSLNASQLTSGTVPLARLSGITNTEISGSAAIDWTKINKSGSSLADLTTRSATDLSSGTLSDSRLSGNVALLNVANTFTHTSGNTFGASGVGTPISVVRDTNAGDSTNTVQMQVGNSGTSQGVIRLEYTNAAAANSPTSRLSFQPRNNAGTAAINPANITFTKTAGADTASIALSNTVGSITLNANGTTAMSHGTTITSGGLTVTAGGLTVTAGSVSLPAGSITDASLSSNVVLENISNTFTAMQNIIGGNTQLEFGSAADYGFLVGKSDGSFVTWGAEFNGTNWVARQTSSTAVKHGTSGLDFYVNSGLTAGNTFTPTSIITINSTGISGNGSQLTALNGTNISTGTVADARLSSNIPLKNGTNAFTGANTLTATASNGTPTAYLGTSATNSLFFDGTNGPVIASNTGVTVQLDSDNNNGSNTDKFSIRHNSGTALGGTEVFSVDSAGNVVATKVTVSADPTQALELATKQYVDNIVSGLDVKASCRVATTTALPTNTQAGNVLTATANGAFPTIDGVTLSLNDRILVKDESTGAKNGIYTLTNAGGAGSQWTLTRGARADSSAEVTAGMYTFIEEGTTNADSGWILTTNNPITLNTTALSFTQFSGAGQVTAGAGLTKTGNTLDVVAADSTITVNADSIQVASGGITNTHINASAGIVYSKLSLSNSIVNADINTSAAIAYSKLSLSNSIVNADIASGAAIADTKLATISTAGKVSDSALSSNVALHNAARSWSATQTNSAAWIFGSTTANNTPTSYVGNAAGNSLFLDNGAGMVMASSHSITLLLDTDNNSTGTSFSIRNNVANLASGSAIFTVSEAGDCTAATFSGSGASLTALNGSNISTGTVANARTTGVASNTANTLVLRDSNARFQAADPSAAQDVATKNYVDTELATGAFVDNETPSGTINGSNLVFTIANTPITGSVQVFSSGVLMLPTTHYSISGTTITFVSGYQPQSGEWLRVFYRK